MFVERIWEDGKQELISMEAGSVLRMYEGMPSCWFLEVDAGGKAHVLQKNNSITGSQEKLRRLHEMHRLVDDAEAVLQDDHSDLDEFGRLLDYTWQLKRQTGENVSTDSIDKLYAEGKSAGALGGKLLGAGGGGFLIFYVPPEKQDSVKEAMKDLLYIPFEFEDSGTKVIYYSPETFEKR